ncbi:10800_t:CDS:2, partial [Entrophospora sp. SA101]
MNDQKNNIFASTRSTYTSDIDTSGGNASTTDLNNINNDPFVILTRSQFLLSPQPEFSHSQFLHGQHLFVETQQPQPFFTLNPHPSHHQNEPITPQQNNQANTINSNMMSHYDHHPNGLLINPQSSDQTQFGTYNHNNNNNNTLGGSIGHEVLSLNDI